MFFAASVSFSLIAGVVADSQDRRKIMIFANLLWGLAILAYVPSQHSFPAILGVTLFAQALDEFFGPSLNSVMPKLVGKRNLLLANSLFYLATYAASFLGYFFAGVFLRFLGYPFVFLLAAGLVLLGVTFTLALPRFDQGRHPLPVGVIVRRAGARLREQLDFLFHNQAASSNLVILAVVSSAATAAGGIAPGFAEQVLRMDARDLSFVGVVPLAAGLLLGAFLINRARWKISVWQSVFGFGATLLCLAFSQNLRFFYRNYLEGLWTFEQLPLFSLGIGMFFFILGVCASTVVVPVTTSLQKITPGRNLGRTFGALATLSGILTTVWVLGFGAAADLWGPAAPIAFVGGGAILISSLIRKKFVIR